MDTRRKSIFDSFAALAILALTAVFSGGCASLRAARGGDRSADGGGTPGSLDEADTLIRHALSLDPSPREPYEETLRNLQEKRAGQGITP